MKGSCVIGNMLLRPSRHTPVSSATACYATSERALFYRGLARWQTLDAAAPRSPRIRATSLPLHISQSSPLKHLFVGMPIGHAKLAVCDQVDHPSHHRGVPAALARSWLHTRCLLTVGSSKHAMTGSSSTGTNGRLHLVVPFTSRFYDWQ